MKASVTLTTLCLALSTALRSAHAQCPNGALPPCPAATQQALPLNDRTWLILPFENTARSQDAALIRHAGLNLLYQELSQWRDVRVISDDRVNDLVRSIPEAQRTPLGLDAARVLARRVGAAQVVLGDYLAVGPQAQIAAKVYDVRTGNQVRLVRERLEGFTGAAALDSMSSTYSRLGAKIMGLPPREGRPQIAGTTSMDAFRAFLQASEMANRLEIAGARALYQRAVDHDSTYAAAQFALYFWRGDSDPAKARQHLLAALRHATRLPEVERLRMRLAAMVDSAPHLSCAPGARLLALDTLEAWGWAAVSVCEQRLRPLGVFPGDSSRRVIAGNYHRARVAARRHLELEPASLFSMASMIFALQLNTQYPFCGPLGPACAADSVWAGALVASGDSVLMPLERWAVARGDPPWSRPAAVRQRRAAYAELGRVMESFLVQYPGQVLARTFLAVSKAETGDLAGAIAIADSTPAYVDGLQFLDPFSRLMIVLAGERTDFTRAVQEFFADTSVRAQGHMYGMLGRYREFTERIPTTRGKLIEAWLPILAGVLPAAFDTLEAPLIANAPNAIAAVQIRESSSLFAFRMRGKAPASDTAAAHPIRRFQAWLSLNDTARARAALARFDTTLTRRDPLTLDDGGWMFAAESFVALATPADSARALALMLDWRRRWPTTGKPVGQRILDQALYNQVPLIFGREWLLLADLAQARGNVVEARNAYQMVVRLWQGGDAPVQPLIARARAALAAYAP